MNFFRRIGGGHFGASQALCPPPLQASNHSSTTSVLFSVRRLQWRHQPVNVVPIPCALPPCIIGAVFVARFVPPRRVGAVSVAFLMSVPPPYRRALAFHPRGDRSAFSIFASPCGPLPPPPNFPSAPSIEDLSSPVEGALLVLLTPLEVLSVSYPHPSSPLSSSSSVAYPPLPPFHATPPPPPSSMIS